RWPWADLPPRRRSSPAPRRATRRSAPPGMRPSPGSCWPRRSTRLARRHAAARRRRPRSPSRSGSARPGRPPRRAPSCPDRSTRARTSAPGSGRVLLRVQELLDGRAVDVRLGDDGRAGAVVLLDAGALAVDVLDRELDAHAADVIGVLRDEGVDRPRLQRLDLKWLGVELDELDLAGLACLLGRRRDAVPR